MDDREKYAFAKSALLAVYAVTQFTGTHEHAKIIVRTALDELAIMEKQND